MQTQVRHYLAKQSPNPTRATFLMILEEFIRDYLFSTKVIHMANL